MPQELWEFYLKKSVDQNFYVTSHHNRIQNKIFTLVFVLFMVFVSRLK